MNYLLAILFIVTTSLVSGEIKKNNKHINLLNYKKYINSMFIEISILVTLLVAQFVLISNGIARLMDM